MKRARAGVFIAVTCCYAIAYADTMGKDGGKPKEPIAARSDSPYRSGSDVLRPEFDALDRDRDGSVSKAESEAYPRAANGQFEQADKDHNGELSMEEFKILHANTSTDRRLGSQ